MPYSYSLPPLQPLRGVKSLTLATIVEQLGGASLRGALNLCGAPFREVMCRFPVDAPNDCEVRGTASTWNEKAGSVDFSVGLQFSVNGKPGEHWLFVVSYEPCDHYAVWLTVLAEGRRTVIASRPEVYCDELSSSVVQLYDEAIEARNGGFIPLGD